MKNNKNNKNKEIKKKKKIEKFKSCDTCDNCVYIGEGDYICIAGDPILIMEDFCPNENYMYFNCRDYEDIDL